MLRKISHWEQNSEVVYLGDQLPVRTLRVHLHTRDDILETLSYQVVISQNSRFRWVLQEGARVP